MKSPESISLAIDKAIEKTEVLFANHTRKTFSEHLEKELMDFLNERFQLAFMNANTDQEIILRSLLNDIVAKS